MLAYLALLPVANTIALRNLLLFILVSLFIFFAAFRPSMLAQPMASLWSRRFWPLLAWVVFLCLFPLWAEQGDVAWANLKGQWGGSIAAWVVGLATVLILGKRGPGLWSLAGASAFLVGLHLMLSAMVWAGLLGANVPSSMPAEMMWQAFEKTFDAYAGWQSFPWGFRGFDPMHGNLGYTSTQGITLFVVCFFLGWQTRRSTWLWGAALGIVICFLSIEIANSRGAILYGLIILMTALVVFILRLRQKVGSSVAYRTVSSLSNYRFILFFLFLAMVLTLVQSIRKDMRWHSMVDKVRVAFLVEEPLNFLCQGKSAELTARIQDHLGTKDPQYIDQLVQGLNGDGGRILLMRAGFELMMQNPVGLDGSRHSYKKLMEERCGHAPVLAFAHSHQGWIDTALALGWGGGLLLAGLMLYFVAAGWRGLADEALRPWAFALFLLASFWLLRGFADSVYREHYLQMQALLLGYLFGRMELARRDGTAC